MADESTKTVAERLNEAVELLGRDEKLTDMCQGQWCGEPLPSSGEVERIIALCRAILFPGYFSESPTTPTEIPHRIGVYTHALMNTLRSQIEAAAQVEQVDIDSADAALQLVERLPELRRVLYTDVTATYRADPAAVSNREVIYCYPGIRAICNHRLAHELYLLGVPILPRMISESAHRETGIDIHPAATIGESFVIDHGTGIVIGATAILGNNVSIYQGVTLGAKSFVTDNDNNPVKGLPRHPIIGNGVVIYSNASVLGRVTVGDNAVIGGNVWLTRDVAPGEMVLQATPSLITKQASEQNR